MTRFGACAALLALGVSLLARPAAAQSQPFSQGTLDRAIDQARSEIGSIAQFYGWNGEIPVVEGPEIDTSAARISISRSRVTDLVAGFRGADVLAAARLVVAHEVWHFVELRRGGTNPAAADSGARRLFECRADLMAGRYLTQLASNPAQPPGPTVFDLEASYAREIAGFLWPFVTEGQESDYPRPGQRVTATHYGAVSVMRESGRLSRGDLEAVDRMLDIRAGEDLDAWSVRACEMLTHFGGVALLAVGVNEPAYETEADGVRFSLSYANTSRRPIDLSVTVVAAATRRDGERRIATGRNWYFPHHVVIPPSGRVQVRGLVPGVRSIDDFWVNYSPNDDNVPITARFAGSAQADRLPEIGTGLSSTDLRFALAIQRLANDAPSGFRHHRAGGAEWSEQSLSYASAIDLPSPEGAEFFSAGALVQVTNEGAAFVNRTLLSNGSPEEAETLYRAVQAAFRRIWPAAPIRERDVDGGKEFRIFITRYAVARVMRHAANGQSGVFFTMAPNLTGLTDQ